MVQSLQAELPSRSDKHIVVLQIGVPCRVFFEDVAFFWVLEKYPHGWASGISVAEGKMRSFEAEFQSYREEQKDRL